MLKILSTACNKTGENLLEDLTLADIEPEREKLSTIEESMDVL